MLSSNQPFRSNYSASSLHFNQPNNSAEQVEVLKWLCEMPYLELVKLVVSRGIASGEGVMPFLEPVSDKPPDKLQASPGVVGSRRNWHWDGKPPGPSQPPPGSERLDRSAPTRPQVEHEPQSLKNSALPLRNDCNSSNTSPSDFSPQLGGKNQTTKNFPNLTRTTEYHPARERSMAAAGRKSSSTGYPYRYSPYFKAAERLIQTQATGVILVDMLADCKLVLTLIIAWCHYSLFNSEGSSRKGEWMTLSRVKMARELGKQDQRIGECLNELAQVGLINYGLAGEEFGVVSSEEFDWLAYDCKYLPRLQGSVAASWWGVRSCQKKHTLFYRLLVMPDEVLPVFEPFNTSSVGSTSGREQHGVPVNGNDRDETGIDGPGTASSGNDQISRAWNDPGRNVRPVQKELELPRNGVGTTRNDLNPGRMTSNITENDQQVVPRSFRGASLNSSCSNVLNDDDVDDEEIKRLREYNQGTIKAKTHPDQSNTTRPDTLKDNLSKAQPQAREQKEWQGNEKEQGEEQEEAEESAREEVVSGPRNNKATGSERLRPSRLQEEIAALKRSPLHWAKFEYLTGQASFPGFEKDGKTRLDESQCVRLAASETTSLEMLKERHAQVLEMWEQGRCYSPLGLFYASVRDNYDPRSEGTVSEETELEQVVRRATKLMQHQSQLGEEEGSGDKEVVDSGTSDGDTCSENEQDSSKGTYPTSKTSSARASSSLGSPTNAPTGQFSFTRPDYNRKPRQTYYRNNSPSGYGSYSRNTRSGWQSSAYSRYQPNYQLWTGSDSAEAEGAGETPAYTEEEEEITAEETQMYQPHSASTQEIDPVVTLERMCYWLGNILRKPDLARKLAGARLELGVDENGKNKATFWLAGDGVDPRSFSLEYKSLIRMAFSTEVAPYYKLQIGNNAVVVPLE